MTDNTPEIDKDTVTGGCFVVASMEESAKSTSGVSCMEKPVINSPVTNNHVHDSASATKNAVFSVKSVRVSSAKSVCVSSAKSVCVSSAKSVRVSSVNSAPMVSIIMNCYNCEQFLCQAIDSVYAQTFTDWEIIFWDNASTDSSGSIARSYDEKLKYFRADKTTPLGDARNLAVEKATGKYLAFLDCDDIWLENKLQAQMEIFEKETDDLGFVYGRSEKFYNNGQWKNQIFRKGDKLPEGWIFNDLVKGNFIPFLSGVFDREKFIECGGFPAHFKNSTDYYIFLNFARKYRVRAVQDVCCMYRVHENNFSRSQRVIAAKENIEAVSMFLPDEAAKAGLKHQYVYLALAYILEKQPIHALKVMLEKGGWNLFFRRILSWIISSRKNAVQEEKHAV